MNEQRIIPETSAPCPRPRPWATYLASEVGSVNVTVARSLAAVGITTAKQLADELDEGFDLTLLKGVKEKTRDKIIAALKPLRESVLYTERMRAEAAREAQNEETKP